MLVFPELLKQPVSNKNMKGYQKKAELYKGAESNLRKELIERRGHKRGGTRITMGEIEEQ